MNLWSKTKRNHGLEHATISLLLAEEPQTTMVAGYSLPGGFLVLGKFASTQVEMCSQSALDRLQNGEVDLAISPFCGTNLVVGAALATFGTLAGYSLAGRGFKGFNRAFSNGLLALVASRPLGRLLQQRYTTSADASGMEIHQVRSYTIRDIPVHWIVTTFPDT